MDETRFLDLVNENPINRVILERLPDLGLNDCWLVSGALFQTAWNITTGRAPTYGVKDYDIFYFDDRDLSWGAEDREINRVADAFDDLDAKIEVRNQARVHLWYPEKFGAPYPPLLRPTQSIDRFLARACMVGVTGHGKGELRLYAPAGLQDVASLVIRPNYSANFQADRYLEKAQRWLRSWPELTVVEPGT